MEPTKDVKPEHSSGDVPPQALKEKGNSALKKGETDVAIRLCTLMPLWCCSLLTALLAPHRAAAVLQTLNFSQFALPIVAWRA